MEPLFATIVRYRFSDQGTEGVLSVPGVGVSFFTLELPWRGNRRSVSCVPSGEYLCGIVQSPRFGRVYHIRDVPERSHVLLHSGNFAGDVSLGLRSHVEGCVLLGLKAGELHGQRAVLCSRMAVRRFMAATNGADVRLVISGGA